jgi:hypothetical protein
MSPTISPVILDTTISQIAPLFLTGAKGDMPAVRDAARAILADYHPVTNEELSLAADIVHNRFRAMEVLAAATEPGLSLNKILRLRGSAVSLSREAHKSQRKLDQLQRARHVPEKPARPAGHVTPAEPGQPNQTARSPEPAATAHPAEPANPSHPSPPPTPAVDEKALAELARQALATFNKHKNMGKYGGMTYDQMLQKRAAAQHMAEAGKRRAEAQRLAAQQATAGTQPAAQPAT